MKQYEIAAYSECFFLPRRPVDLAYSEGEDDCLIHADDCYLMFNAVEMEGHVSSVVMILLIKTYTSRAFASKKYHFK